MKLELREASQQFSTAMKAVRAGKQVVLTERGRPIAVIKPIRESDAHQTATIATAEPGDIALRVPVILLGGIIGEPMSRFLQNAR